MKQCSNETIKQCRGFTLVETIIYIALIAITVGSFVSFGMQMSDLRTKARVMQEVELSGKVLMNMIKEYVEKAEGVISPLPGGVAENSIELNMPEADPNINIYESNGEIFLIEGTSDPVKISSNGVEVTNLSFENSASAGKRPTIEIAMDIKYRYDYSMAYKYDNQYRMTVSGRY